MVVVYVSFYLGFNDH